MKTQNTSGVMEKNNQDAVLKKKIKMNFFLIPKIRIFSLKYKKLYI